MFQRPVFEDDTLFMVTLPSGIVRYISESCLAFFCPAMPVSPELDNLDWQHFIPEHFQADITAALEAILGSGECRIVRFEQEVEGISRHEEIHFRPVWDERGKLIAIGWYGSSHSQFKHHYYAIFHQSAIAQWVIDVRPVYHYLQECHLQTPLDIDEKARTDEDFLPVVRELLPVMDANLAALNLYAVESVADFRYKAIGRVMTDREIINVCYAILSIDRGPVRQIYQAELALGESSRKNLWFSCEVPALEFIDQGLFVSALDISAMQQAEQELEEREQFLSTILKTVPDYLMVYDFKRREPIFQNRDILKYLGYSSKDVEATDRYLLSYITHPEDVITDKVMLEMYRTLANGKVFETTIRLQNSQGEWHHFFFRSASLDKDAQGNIINAVVVARDITEVLKTQQILSEQQRRYQLLADNFSDVVITTDTLFRVNYVSPSLEHVLGYHPEVFLRQGNAIECLGLSQDAERLAGRLADSVLQPDLEGYAEFNEVLETEALTAHGSTVPLELRISIVRDEHNLLEGMLILARDISERRQYEAEMQMAAKVFENSLDGIYITDNDGNIVQVNQAFCDITGYAPEQVLLQKPSLMGSGWHETSFEQDIKPLLDAKGHWSGELMSRRTNGEAFLVWMSITAVKDSRGKSLGLITTFRDITEAKSSEESIRKLAYYDPLTDLPNRLLFHDRLLQALQRANRNRHYIAILFLDLDGFKAVNDDLGHALGDRLLTEVAKRLKDSIRSDDTVARMGGDEFTIILNTLENRELAESAAVQIANKVIRRLNEPFVLQGKEARIGTSIGIALYPDDALAPETLIKMADTAMYHAKQAGKNGYQFYTDDMHQRAEQRQLVERDLRNAILEEEFVLAFQPQVRAQGLGLTGFEALLRWRHPDKGLIPPSGFMKSFDELGLGNQMGDWVFRRACEQIKTWQAQGCSRCSVAVNVFSRHYRDGELASSVAAVLEETGIDPQLLTVEISENLIMKDIGYAYATLVDLKALGVRIAIDDFATGLFSLQYLSRLPVDELKIDRQFVQSVDKDEDQHRLVNTLIAIAHGLNCEVLAEGVERESQRNLLQAAGCDRLQGYLFSRPLLDEDVGRFLAAET